MDLINKLVGGQGCTADGAAAARNPLARLVDSVLDTAPVCIACLNYPFLVFVIQSFPSFSPLSLSPTHYFSPSSPTSPPLTHSLPPHPYHYN